jgi:hypothetical protein
VDPLFVSFVGGPTGAWRIDRIAAVIGDGLPAAERVDVLDGVNVRPDNPRFDHAAWMLRGVTSNARYTNRTELDALRQRQEPLARPTATRPALALARRLHHSRDLGEPFDFLTWFEYAPEHSNAFEELVRRLRTTREWDYVDREVDIRLSRLA